MQDHVSRLVGLDGFRVRGVVEEGHQLDLEVELVARAQSCPHCHGAELEVHERPLVAVRDLPFGGRVATLRWRKRRYRCKGCRRTHTESCAQAPPRQRLTRRFACRLAERAGSGGAHAEIAREEGISRYQVTRAMRIAAAERTEGGPRSLPRRLSLDEAAHRRGYGNLATVLSDLDARCVHEVLDGRSAAVVKRFLGAVGEAERAAVEVVCIDPYEPYRSAVRATLPNAVIVADPFHVVRGAGMALDGVRRARQRRARAAAPGKAGMKASWDPRLYRTRHLLLRAKERLTESQRRRLGELFAREPAIAEAWALKEALRSVYATSGRAQAAERLDRFLAEAARSGLKPFEAYARGMSGWREEILAYVDQPASNGYAEGVINKVKVIKRRAYGLPDFEGFRERVLLACGRR
ncbi:MAG TPA: ISL3 family transposase [Solirubrobacterales bacterium]|nr:ISL3 family transposase [Solirubrobacterales bacterium]